jgi:hypothetical protein
MITYINLAFYLSNKKENKLKKGDYNDEDEDYNDEDEDYDDYDEDDYDDVDEDDYNEDCDEDDFNEFNIPPVPSGYEEDDEIEDD